MAFKFRYFLITTVIVLAFASQECYSQSKRQIELEEKRVELQKQIKEITRMLFDVKKEKKSVVNAVENLNYKISVRKNLIRITNQQANLLTLEINDNQNQISNKRDKIRLLKDEYAKMILKSYKNRSVDNKLMFVLSSSNFQQAYRRLQYIKQYADYQKSQAEIIKQETKQLQKFNKELLRQKKDKDKLVSENKAAKAILDKELIAQKSLIEEIQKNLTKFSAQIKVKQKETEKLDAEIRKLIREAIAASNKKAGKTGKQATFALTPEQRKLAATFTANKGKLPWPVVKGVVKLRFGTNPSPIDPKIKIRSNGVRIATNQSEPVRAVWEGTVQGVMTPKNGNNTIMIRHGNYITVYKNLSKFYVSKGDKVTTKQVIGEVLTNKVSGESILSFGIYKDSVIQNPSAWIYKLN